MDLSDEHLFLEILEYNGQWTLDAEQLRPATDPAMKALSNEWHSLLDGPPEVSPGSDGSRL